MQSKIWFTADVHLHHLSIMYFRPKRREAAGVTLEELKELESEKEMGRYDISMREKLEAHKEDILNRYDSWMIDKWNSTIKKRDTVYILGDLCLGNKDVTESLLRKLNGKKYLIIGNHDKSSRGLENYFEWTGSIKEAKFNNEQFPFIRPNETFCVEMCHYPLMAWNRRTHGACHLHGHVHGALDDINKANEELRLDVGVDSKIANLGFVDLETIYNYFEDMRKSANCETYQDYAEWLMAKQGFRM